MFRRIDDFLMTYGHMIESTSKVFATLNDKNVNRPVAPGHRTLGQIAWHMVVSIPEMMNRAGLGLSSVDPESMPPSSPRDIAAGYKAVTEELVKAIGDGWNDETLQQTDEMYGEKWPRGMTAAALISHEAHHRGQMTVLLRQAGGVVPGVYGPSKEEWANYGTEAPPY